MAIIFQNLIIIFFLHLMIFQFCPPTHSMSIHDLLKSKGLPPGLFPKGVSNYTFSSPENILQVFFDEPCLTKFDSLLALYDSVVTANLTHGCLTAVHGFLQEELFVWLPVIQVLVDDPSSGSILFDIGLAYKQLSLSLFEDPPDCKYHDALKKKTRKEKGIEAQR